MQFSILLLIIIIIYLLCVCLWQLWEELDLN